MISDLVMIFMAFGNYKHMDHQVNWFGFNSYHSRRITAYHELYPSTLVLSFYIDVFFSHILYGLWCLCLDYITLKLRIIVSSSLSSLVVLKIFILSLLQIHSYRAKQFRLSIQIINRYSSPCFPHKPCKPFKIASTCRALVVKSATRLI